jgi:hypothetical protein
VPSPKLHYNMGIAYRGMNRSAEALESFERFLSQASDAPADARQIATQARAELVSQVATLNLTADTDGAEIFLDGKSQGATPRPSAIYVDPGPHQLSVEKTGVGSPYTERFTASRGQHLAVHALLMRRPEEPPAEPPAASGDWMKPAAWVTAAGAALGIGFGAYEILQGNSKLNDYNTSSTCGVPNVKDPPNCVSLHDDGKAAQKLSAVGFVIGGALAVTSTILFIVSSDAGKPRSTKPEAVSLGCAPTVGGWGLVCATRF